METLGKIVFAVISIAIGTLISAFVLVKLWGWFITPTFGIVQLTILQAIGFDLVKQWLLYSITMKLADIKPTDKTKSLTHTMFEALFVSTGIGTVTLLIGYAIHLLM